MEEKRRDEIEINWTELAGAILSKLWIILLVVIVCILVAFWGTKYLITPMYTSSSSVYIMNRQNESQISASDLSSADMLTKDCQKLAMSRTVLDEVSEVMALDLSYEQMKEKVSVSIQNDTRVLVFSVIDENPERAKEIVDTVTEITRGDLSYEQMKEKVSVSIQNDTRVLVFSVIDENPERAKEIVDTVTEITRGKIKEIMGVDEVNIIDSGDIAIAPSSPNVIMNIFLAAAIGAFAAIAVIVIVFIADDTIKTSDDIVAYLGTTALGVIPNVEDNKRAASARKEKRRRRE